MARRQKSSTPEPPPPPPPPSPYKGLLPSPTQTYLEMQTAAKELDLRATVAAETLEAAKAAVIASAFEHWKLGAIRIVVSAIRAGKLGPIFSFSPASPESEDENFDFDDVPWGPFLNDLVRELGESGWLVTWEYRSGVGRAEYPTVLFNGVKPGLVPPKP